MSITYNPPQRTLQQRIKPEQSQKTARRREDRITYWMKSILDPRKNLEDIPLRRRNWIGAKQVVTITRPAKCFNGPREVQ